jgi:hypothetical protein
MTDAFRKLRSDSIRHNHCVALTLVAATSRKKEEKNRKKIGPVLLRQAIPEGCGLCQRRESIAVLLRVGRAGGLIALQNRQKILSIHCALAAKLTLCSSRFEDVGA